MSHRLLVVGVGSIGERHVRTFGKTGRADIRIAENNPELRSRIASTYGISVAYESLDAGLSDPAWKPQTVLIATPAQLHIPMARQVVARGVNVLIEKPLSISLDGINELIAEIEAKQVKSTVLYTYRAHPLVVSLRDAIASGKYGKPVQIVATWGQHFPTYRPAYRTIYYTKREMGGGAIQDVMTHAVNAGEFLVGPIEQVMADAEHKVLEGVDVEDTVHLIARHRGGVMGCYSLNQHQAPNENSVTVICEGGTLRWELNNSRWLSMTKPGGEWTVEATFSQERDDIFIAQANYALDVMEGRQASRCTVQDALQTLRVNLAILAASAKPPWRAV